MLAVQKRKNVLLCYNWMGGFVWMNECIGMRNKVGNPCLGTSLSWLLQCACGYMRMQKFGESRSLIWKCFNLQRTIRSRKILEMHDEYYIFSTFFFFLHFKNSIIEAIHKVNLSEDPPTSSFIKLSFLIMVTRWQVTDCRIRESVSSQLWHLSSWK